MEKPATVDEYIKYFPPAIQHLLQQIRETIRQAAPGAEEVISYQMPALRLNGVLLYYAAFKDHVSLFPAGSSMSSFKDELAGYKKSKGTIQFPLDKPLPLDLVRRIVEYRVKENLSRAATKGYGRSRRSAK